MTEAITLAVNRMKTMPWAIYRARRLYYAPANAARSVDSVLLGGHRTVHTALTEVSRLVDIPLTKNEEIAGAPARDGDRDTHPRLWLRRRGDGAYPTQEEFYTVAPAQAQDKELDSFATPGPTTPTRHWPGWTAVSTRRSPLCNKPPSRASAAATRPEPLTGSFRFARRDTAMSLAGAEPGAEHVVTLPVRQLDHYTTPGMPLTEMAGLLAAVAEDYPPTALTALPADSLTKVLDLWADAHRTGRTAIDIRDLDRAVTSDLAPAVLAWRTGDAFPCPRLADTAWPEPIPG